VRRVLEALAFSSVWIAAAAALLCAATGQAMGVGIEPHAMALAACGTFVVYSVDRLRDLERDRATSPRRSAFVAQHDRVLRALTGLAGLASLPLAVAAGPRVLWLLAPVALLGLGHRRLKRFTAWKALYITAAWVVVVVGLPALGRGAQHLGWIAAVVGLSILANAIVSNLRDGEAATSRWGAHVPARLAIASACLACVLALLAPRPVLPLLAVALATLGSVVAFRPDESYGLVVVDGALGVGAALALWLA
jgi:hypothetical protein